MTVATFAGEPRANELWAITCYFNPAGYRRRRANYRLFRERLGVPLLAVELAYGPDFELAAGDADILVQLRGGDVMWQKERLLNLALRALPDDCRKVVWVDCDIIFGRGDWPETVSRVLDRCMILQPFEHVHHQPRDWTAGEMSASAAELSRKSASSAIASGTPAAALLNERPRDGEYSYARGFAWAARRELLDRHGFYDACVVGSGDRAMASATYGDHDSLVDLHVMNGRQAEHYLAWAGPFHQTIGTATGWMTGDIYHLWHGERRDRGYMRRHEILPRFEFDPFEDITIDASGCWRWSTDKPQLHVSVREYFSARREDG